MYNLNSLSKECAKISFFVRAFGTTTTFVAASDTHLVVLATMRLCVRKEPTSWFSIIPQYSSIALQIINFRLSLTEYFINYGLKDIKSLQVHYFTCCKQ